MHKPKITLDLRMYSYDDPNSRFNRTRAQNFALSILFMKSQSELPKIVQWVATERSRSRVEVVVDLLTPIKSQPRKR
jgi:hypothetical protein